MTGRAVVLEYGGTVRFTDERDPRHADRIDILTNGMVVCLFTDARSVSIFPADAIAEIRTHADDVEPEWWPDD